MDSKDELGTLQRAMHKYVLICEVNNTLPLLHCVLGANTLPKHKHLKPGGSRDVERLILGGGLNRPAQARRNFTRCQLQNYILHSTTFMNHNQHQTHGSSNTRSSSITVSATQIMPKTLAVSAFSRPAARVPLPTAPVCSHRPQHISTTVHPTLVFTNAAELAASAILIMLNILAIGVPSCYALPLLLFICFLRPHKQ
jgi:hypothetical protein